MIVDVLGTVVGCLINGFIMYVVMRLIFSRFFDKKTAIFVSFIAACILELVLNYFLNSFVYGFIRYIPAVFLWFVVDLIRINKGSKHVRNH